MMAELGGEVSTIDPSGGITTGAVMALGGATSER